MKVLPLIIILIIPGRLYADEKKAADIISYGTVVTQIGLNAVHAWKEPNRKHALVMFGTQIFFIVVTSETVKRFVHEDRPDHSDNLSFWSEHSALGCNTSLGKGDGWQFNLSIGLAIATPVGRIVAKKHHWWDTAAGCGVGILFNKAMR